MAVADGHTLHVLVIDVGLHHAESTVADSDEAHDHSLTGSGCPVLAEGTGRDDGGKADGGTDGG